MMRAVRDSYLHKLRQAIRDAHGCPGIHSATAYVRAARGDWEGKVEVFDVDHPHAKKCYAWGCEGDGGFRATCMLEIAPVDSPSTAVEAALAAGDGK